MKVSNLFYFLVSYGLNIYRYAKNKSESTKNECNCKIEYNWLLIILITSINLLRKKKNINKAVIWHSLLIPSKKDPNLSSNSFNFMNLKFIIVK